MVEVEDGESWIYKNKGHGSFDLAFLILVPVFEKGRKAVADRFRLLALVRLGMLSATASLGLSLLWDTDVGLSHVDKYMYSAEENIKVSPSSPFIQPGILRMLPSSYDQSTYDYASRVSLVGWSYPRNWSAARRYQDGGRRCVCSACWTLGQQ